MIRLLLPLQKNPFLNGIEIYKICWFINSNRTIMDFWGSHEPFFYCDQTTAAN